MATEDTLIYRLDYIGKHPDVGRLFRDSKGNIYIEEELQGDPPLPVIVQDDREFGFEITLKIVENPYLRGDGWTKEPLATEPVIRTEVEDVDDGGG